MSYGGLYQEDDGWCYTEWDSKESDFVKRIRRQSGQYAAFAALADAEKKNATQTSQYVSRCDEYIQFRKHYK